MNFSARNKYFVITLILIIVLINIYLVIKRQSANAKIFDVPVSIGTEIKYSWAESDKELLFLYFKPTCPACLEIKPIINEIAEQYKNQINVIGLCTNKYYKQLSASQEYNFNFIELDVIIHDALHLAFTPQAVMIDDYKVSFAFQFNEGTDIEINRLLNYLKSKYDSTDK